MKNKLAKRRHPLRRKILRKKIKNDLKKKKKKKNASTIRHFRLIQVGDSLAIKKDSVLRCLFSEGIIISTVLKERNHCWYV
mgnify:CR=1 FL=1